MNKLSYQDVKDIAKGRADRSKKLNGMNWMACICIVMVVIVLVGLISVSVISSNSKVDSIVYTADNGSQITVKEGYATLDGTSYILDKGDKDNNTPIYGIFGWMILLAMIVFMAICVYWYEIACPKYKDAIIQYYLDKGELPDSDFNEK